MKKTVSVFCCVWLALFPFLTARATQTEAEDGTALPTAAEVYAALPVEAKAYALMDADTGTLLAAKNETEALYPASVTKIMSLLLVCEALRDGQLAFDETLTCSETAAEKGGSQIWLKPGEEMTVRDLLKATAVYSANDACTLLGEAVAGSEAAFVAQMNARAKALGMEHTHFDNCTGLDDDTTTHLASAYDVALMSRALLEIPFITDYTTIWMDTLRNGETQLVNTNRLIRFYPGAIGLKTGTTSKAGCCVSAAAQRDGMRLIAVVLGAGSSAARFEGAKTLLDHGFANYEIYTPALDGPLDDVRVTHGERDAVSVAAPRFTPVLLKKGAASDVSVKVELAAETEAPVEKGARLGTVRFDLGDTPIAEYPLTAAASVGRLRFFGALVRIFHAFSSEKAEKK